MSDLRISPLPSLRILRLSHNPISRLSVLNVPNLRTLYIDSASLIQIDHSAKLLRIENLSLRDQGGNEPMQLELLGGMGEVRRLYLSGNPLPLPSLLRPLPSLTYLELALCRLTTLPPLANIIPNVRVLNLNYNLIGDSSLSSLEGLTRMKKLSMIGGRIKKVAGLVKVIKGMQELEEWDGRMNPLTLSFYPPFLSSPSNPMNPSHLSPSPSPSPPIDPAYTALDARFRASLPDNWYLRRLVYRGIFVGACKNIKYVDGLEITTGEKLKLSKVGQRVGELRVNQWKRRKEAEEQTVKELRSTGKRLRAE
jgi:protein NUD1